MKKTEKQYENEVKVKEGLEKDKVIIKKEYEKEWDKLREFLGILT